MEWHYLDHAAGAPARPEVVAAMLPLLTDGYGNPSGGHALARRARAELDVARERLAAVVGCQPGEVAFTSGGTEADHLAVAGTLGARGGTGRCAVTDHPAVVQPVLRRGGATFPVDERGRVDLERLAAALDEDVALVSVALVGNELGVVQSMSAIAEVVRRSAPGALLHADASQALSWIDVSEATAACDLVTLASHKCGGPKGIGALVIRGDAHVDAQVVGGGQERGRRAGTQNVAGAVGFAVAVEQAVGERSALASRATAWRERLVGTVLGAVPDAVATAARCGDASHLVPGIVHLCLAEVESEALLFLLEQDHRVLAAAGSSCSSGAISVSSAALEVGLAPELARGALRVSFGWATSDDDVDAATTGIVDVATRLRAHAHGGARA